MSLNCQHVFYKIFIIYLYEKQAIDHAVYHSLQIYFQIVELVMCIYLRNKYHFSEVYRSVNYTWSPAK